MQRFSVTGMSCAACSARVEKAVSAVPGVASCSVNLLLNSMQVEGSATADAILSAVEKAGYGAAPIGAAPKDRTPGNPQEDASEAGGIRTLRTRFFASLALLAPLMYFSMGHMMWGWPLPRWFTEPEPNHVAMGLVQMLLALAVMVVNQPFFVNGFKGLWNSAPNMDSLVALGSGASFAYSVAILFAMTRGQVTGGAAGAEAWMDDYYFEGAAMILALITFGKLLEAVSKGRTTSALKSLLRLAPRTATVVRDGTEREIPVADVRVGDVFLVRPGANVPVDGEVLEGESAIDESALTGESLPVDKATGDRVASGTTNASGFLRCRATRVGEDTTLAQIVRMVGDAAASKAPIAKMADRVAGVFVPAVLFIAAVTFALWYLLAPSVGFGGALRFGVAVLVVSCPCALGLATPVAIMVGSGLGARNGILFKTAAALEGAGRTTIAVLDKTGTLTRGEPRVVALDPEPGVTDTELLALAAALEAKSEHPLGRAIVAEAKARGLAFEEADDFRALAGSGVEGTVQGAFPVPRSPFPVERNHLACFGGSVVAAKARGVALSDALRARAETHGSAGRTPLVFARGGQAIGLIAVADTLKDDAVAGVRALRDMGVRVVMLTGDNERTARAIATAAGIGEVVAGVLPDGKHRVVEDLKKQGRVAMVGDGVNDAPALVAADLGIAIGAGADVAVDAADVVLVKSRLDDVPAALRLGRATLRNIRENLFWAFFYNVLLIPLAAGLWSVLFSRSITMSPTLGAAAMGLSSVCVVANALRLNLFKVRP